MERSRTLPETRYAKSGDVHIAYQIFGMGPFDLVVVPGFISHVEWFWEEPACARLLGRLASFSRLILFDKRGSGLSDRVPQVPTLEQRMDDVRAVLDAAGSERATIIGVSEGGPMSVLFAATCPERTAALVLYGSFAEFSSLVATPQELEFMLQFMDASWGTGRKRIIGSEIRAAAGVVSLISASAAERILRRWRTRPWHTANSMGTAKPKSPRRPSRVRTPSPESGPSAR